MILNLSTKKLRYLIWSIVVLSIALMVIAPGSGLKHQLSSSLPWVAISLLVTESLFVIGLVVMAWTVGHSLGPNPLSWRRQLPLVLKALPSSNWFWAGFAANLLGALGTILIMILAVVTNLPWQAWGLLAVPAADLVVTVLVRTIVLVGLGRRSAK
jgi:hypothetical protein